jgi:hypothetical protein
MGSESIRRKSQGVKNLGFTHAGVNLANPLARSTCSPRSAEMGAEKKPVEVDQKNAN